VVRGRMPGGVGGQRREPLPTRLMSLNVSFNPNLETSELQIQPSGGPNNCATSREWRDFAEQGLPIYPIFLI
jgi:hypothetical protein